MNLWASDSYHASAYGYCLHALVDFGEITGLGLRVLGFDTVSRALGFTSQQATATQGFAAAAITAAVPEPSTGGMLACEDALVAWFGRRRGRPQGRRQPDDEMTGLGLSTPLRHTKPDRSHG